MSNKTISQFKENIPNRRNESYKYTNLTSTLEKFESFDFSETQFDIEKLKVSGALNIFIQNGKINDLSDLGQLEFSKEIDAYSARSEYNYSNDFLVNLNTLETVNYQFSLSQNTSIEKPIYIFHIISNADTHLFNSKTSFTIGKNSELKVVEVFINTEDNSVFYNHTSQSNIDKNSKFIHIHHQTLNQNSAFGNSITAQVARDANYESFTTTLGASLSRTNIHIDINDEGANATASGVYALQDKQHSDINSYISHNAPHTESHQLYKGIMNDKSRGVFTGLIKVQKDAQLINSNQLNRNLLLTKGAHANSRPQLEIFADDVKCAHGSTTGQLSDAELFYFQSRGIRTEKAQMMLAKAFSYDVILKIDDENIRNYLSNEITEKFEAKAFKL